MDVYARNCKAKGSQLNLPNHFWKELSQMGEQHALELPGRDRVRGTRKRSALENSASHMDIPSHTPKWTVPASAKSQSESRKPVALHILYRICRQHISIKIGGVEFGVACGAVPQQCRHRFWRLRQFKMFKSMCRQHFGLRYLDLIYNPYTTRFPHWIGSVSFRSATLSGRQQMHTYESHHVKHC